MRAHLISSLLIFSLSLTSEPGLSQTEPEPLNHQLAAYAHGRPRTATVTPSGRWLLVAEGGALTFVDTYDGSNYIEDGFTENYGHLKVQLSEHGYLPARMILDPLAADPPVGGANDLLYVAAGRDGLWVARLDSTDSENNRSWRVDDSGNLIPTTQNSRRWCSDVKIATVGGTQYLLALFSAKGKSWMRAYELTRIRSIAQADYPEETTHEIAADKAVKLWENPHAPNLFTYDSYGGCVAMAMAVDQVSADEADVYVALGHHGLAKVNLTMGAGPTGTMIALVSPGPVFGTGSPYADDTASSNHPHDTYVNLVMEDAKAYHETIHVDREELPFVTNVEVFRGQIDGQDTHHLFVSVDHLFWMVFDLKNQSFSPSMPILHHAGVRELYDPETRFHEQPAIAPESEFKNLGWTLQKPGRDEYGFAHCARVVEAGGKHYLVVSTGRKPILDEYLVAVYENVPYDGLLRWGGGDAELPAAMGTWLYELGYDGREYTYEPMSFYPIGGQEVLVPELQELADDPTYQLKVFTAGTITVVTSPILRRGGVGMGLVPTNEPPPATPTVLRRTSEDVLGKTAFSIGTLEGEPNLVITGVNDGYLGSSGFLSTEYEPSTQTWSFLVHPRLTGEPERMTGHIWEAESQWAWGAGGNPPVEYRYLWAEGKTPTPPTGAGNPWRVPARWYLARLAMPASGDYDLISLNAHWYFTGTEDRFTNAGRPYYMGAYMSQEFDAFLATQLIDHRHLFAGIQRTPEGLTVVDRGQVLTYVDLVTSGEDVGLDEAVPNPADRIKLVTHPEFNNMSGSDTTLQYFWRGEERDTGDVLDGNQDMIGHTFTWLPRLIEVKDPATDQMGAWVLAVPCGTINADPDWDIYDENNPDHDYGNEDWLPTAGSIWETYFGHGLVQFWRMVDEGTRFWPEVTTLSGVTDNSPLRKIIGSHGPHSFDPVGNIWPLESIHMPNPDRVYLFCGDLAGRLYVYQIENVLYWDDDPEAPVDPQYLVASWTSDATPALFDDLPGMLMDIEVDYRGGSTAIVYLTVRRIGVVMLRFNPEGTPGSELQLLGRIQLPSAWADHMHLRANEGTENGPVHLLVSDYDSGIRLFGEE